MNSWNCRSNDAETMFTSPYDILKSEKSEKVLDDQKKYNWKLKCYTSKYLPL